MTIRERKPIEPISDERRRELRQLKGVIILAMKPGANAYEGYVEHSFSMGWDQSHVLFFWDSKRRTGEYWSDEHMMDIKRNHPDWNVVRWKVDDPELPVVLDWDKWIDAQAFNPNTLSGVTNKFASRNFRFEMKDD